MSANTKIEWCDHTFNPWTGCTKVSEGCAHCYAEGWSKRAGAKVGKWGPGAPRVRTTPANWHQPMKWNAQADAFAAEHGRRQRVFCASLADWADNAVAIDWLVDLLELVRTTPHLDWLLLTKRIGIVERRLQEAHSWLLDHWPAVDAQLLSHWLTDWVEGGNPPMNVWIGATIVNQDEADRDIPKLLEMPAHRRFLSMEPLLGPVDLANMEVNGDAYLDPLTAWTAEEMTEMWGEPCDAHPRIDWVIAGGESGPGARPSHPGWFRTLRDQCVAAGVPFHLKQWGEWCTRDDMPEIPDATGDIIYTVDLSQQRVESVCLGIDGTVHADIDKVPQGAALYRLGKKFTGRMLDCRIEDGFPS